MLEQYLLLYQHFPFSRWDVLNRISFKYHLMNSTQTTLRSTPVSKPGIIGTYNWYGTIPCLWAVTFLVWNFRSVNAAYTPKQNVGNTNIFRYTYYTMLQETNACRTKWAKKSCKKIHMWKSKSKREGIIKRFFLHLITSWWTDQSSKFYFKDKVR